MKSFVSFFFDLLIVLLVTAFTQVGGVIYLLSKIVYKLICTFWNAKFRLKKLFIFVVLYCFSCFAIVPPLAALFGREPLLKNERIHSAHIMSRILNRHYVRPSVNRVLEQTLKQLPASIHINCLDANFPFIDGFPLLPHLSHNDGRKLDIGLLYQNPDGTLSSLQITRSGYGVFEAPLSTEIDQISRCKHEGFFQYDYPKYFTFGTIHPELQFAPSATRQVIEALLASPEIEKLFIEPHLKSRLQLSDSRVCYHGCYAVRHDDHIHFQVR